MREPHLKEKIKAFGFIFSLCLIYLFRSIQDLETHQFQKLVFFFQEQLLSLKNRTQTAFLLLSVCFDRRAVSHLIFSHIKA